MDLKGNLISTIPDGIGNWKGYTIDLSFNNITFISPSIANASNLGSLNLDWNSMTTIPKELFACRQLNGLSLSNNKIQTLPQGLAEMIYLQSLGLRGNRIEKADVLGSLINNSTTFSLYLDLSNNKIKSISSWNVSRATNIELTLKLGENRITEIPKW
jgi:leucine-rich repeat protein SHOC2